MSPCAPHHAFEAEPAVVESSHYSSATSLRDLLDLGLVSGSAALGLLVLELGHLIVVLVVVVTLVAHATHAAHVGHTAHAAELREVDAAEAPVASHAAHATHSSLAAHA